MPPNHVTEFADTAAAAAALPAERRAALAATRLHQLGPHGAKPPADADPEVASFGGASEPVPMPPPLPVLSPHPITGVPRLYVGCVP